MAEKNNKTKSVTEEKPAEQEVAGQDFVPPEPETVADEEQPKVEEKPTEETLTGSLGPPPFTIIHEDNPEIIHGFDTKPLESKLPEEEEEKTRELLEEIFTKPEDIIPDDGKPTAGYTRFKLDEEGIRGISGGPQDIPGEKIRKVGNLPYDFGPDGKGDVDFAALNGQTVYGENRDQQYKNFWIANT